MYITSSHLQCIFSLSLEFGFSCPHALNVEKLKITLLANPYGVFTYVSWVVYALANLKSNAKELLLLL